MCFLELHIAAYFIYTIHIIDIDLILCIVVDHENWTSYIYVYYLAFDITSEDISHNCYI